MKMQPKKLRQPGPNEVQALYQLFQSGRLQETEARAQTMLRMYPNASALYNLLGMCQQGQGKYREAVSNFRKLLTIDPRIAEIHFNLGVILTQLGETQPAIASYRKALQLKPDLTVGHFNLGALLQSEQMLHEAADHYRKAIALEPGFFAALANLGTILQQRGQLEEAEQCYRRVLALHPDARGHFNLGTTLYGQGEHEEAIQQFTEAVGLDPDFGDAWNSLGETFRDRGEMDDAVRCYKKALAVQPDHSRAKYNLGEFFCLVGKFDEAIPYFEESDFADARERTLQCLYKTGQFELFRQQFDEFAEKRRHNSILLGTLSTHYATNFRRDNDYNFCRDPMNFVLHTHIGELTANDSPLLRQLLHDIEHLAISERKQGRLYYGIQSAGNLLQRSEQSFQTLAALIRDKIVEYRRRFAGSNCELIQGFPGEIEFTSSWYLRMKKGGYLTSHIHEEGWVSGCVYLKLPEKSDAHEGSFEYSTDGDDYPRLHDDFPSHVVDQQVGDIVIFPSSLFHRTVPFHSGEERVCVAFDVKPGPLPQAKQRKKH